jgi:hypothetical protein
MSAESVTLRSLRARGAQTLDPTRFHFLESLERRLPGQPEAVRQVLAARLQSAIDAYAARCHPPAAVQTGSTAAASATCAPPTQPVSAGGGIRPAAQARMPSPLALLNRKLQDRAQLGAGATAPGTTQALTDLNSVRQFSAGWSRIAAEQQVMQALQRAPDNAGPLNPHKLVLRTLNLMKSLSPDYLRHFVSEVETLLWLEQACAKPGRPAGTRAAMPAAKAVRRSGRSGKR